jgi:hypothetical protein
MTDWSRPPRAGELELLEPFCGEWVSEDEHLSTPWATAGGTGRSRLDFHTGLHGYCLVSDYEGDTPFGTINGHGVWYFDRERGKYRVFWYDTFSNALDGEGDFEVDGSLVMTYRYRMAGEEILERHTMRLTGPDAMEQEIANRLDGQYRVASKLHWRRRTP